MKKIDNINEIKNLFRRLNKRTLVFKDQIDHFLRPLDVLDFIPNLKVSCCNLPKKKTILSSEEVIKRYWIY